MNDFDAMGVEISAMNARPWEELVAEHPALASLPEPDRSFYMHAKRYVHQLAQTARMVELKKRLGEAQGIAAMILTAHPDLEEGMKDELRRIARPLELEVSQKQERAGITPGPL